MANDGALVRQWCLARYGVTLKSELGVDPDIRAGKLVEVLGDYAQPVSPFQMLFPPRRVRAMAEQLTQMFQDLEGFDEPKSTHQSAEHSKPSHL